MSADRSPENTHTEPDPIGDIATTIKGDHTCADARECADCRRIASVLWMNDKALRALWASRARATLAEAVRDVCWKATPTGYREGDVATYLIPAGALHRLVGAAQGAGISASLRAPTSHVHDHLPYRPVCNERDVDGQLRGACLNDNGSVITPPAGGEQ